MTVSQLHGNVETAMESREILRWPDPLLELHVGLEPGGITPARDCRRAFPRILWVHMPTAFSTGRYQERSQRTASFFDDPRVLSKLKRFLVNQVQALCCLF